MEELYSYRKIIDVPQEWKEKTVKLKFEGVYQVIKIYVNGILAGKNSYGHTYFFVLLNAWLNYGMKNEIEIIIDSPSRVDVSLVLC